MFGASKTPAPRWRAGQDFSYEKSGWLSNFRKKGALKNLISAAHIASSSYLDKCNPFISSLISSPSTRAFLYLYDVQSSRTATNLLLCKRLLTTIRINYL